MIQDLEGFVFAGSDSRWNATAHKVEVNPENLGTHLAQEPSEGSQKKIPPQLYEQLRWNKVLPTLHAQQGRPV